MSAGPHRGPPMLLARHSRYCGHWGGKECWHRDGEKSFSAHLFSSTNKHLSNNIMSGPTALVMQDLNAKRKFPSVFLAVDILHQHIKLINLFGNTKISYAMVE